MQTVKISVVHLLLELFIVSVVLLVILRFAKGRTWRGRRTGD